MFEVRGWAAALVLVFMVFACGDDEAARVGLGSSCVNDDECEKGLYCSEGGDLEGRCTADCEDTAYCEAHFGNGARCYALSQCARPCTSHSQCNGGSCVELTSGASICISEPPPPVGTGGTRGGSGGQGGTVASGGTTSTTGGTATGGVATGGVGTGGTGASGGTGGNSTGGTGATTCTSDDDCGALNCCPLLGSQRTCELLPCPLRPGGDPCTSDLDCISQSCLESVCAPAPGEVGAPCTQPSGCVSGFCCQLANAVGKICNDEACPALVGDPCPGEFCPSLMCYRDDSIYTGYCSRSCGEGCGYNSAGRQNVCVRLTQGSSPSSSCRPGCSTEADCTAIDTRLGCLTSDNGTVTACDYTTAGWHPDL